MRAGGFGPDTHNKTETQGIQAVSSARESLEFAIQRALALPAEEAAAVGAELEPVVFAGGEWLFRQGDPGDALYVLVRGRLQVWIEGPEPGGPGARLVAEVGPGETVGEIGLLAGGTRSAGLRAARDSLLLRLDAKAFDRLSQRRPQLTRQLAGSIATRLRDRTAGLNSIRRSFRTVALLPLDDGPGARALAERLVAALEIHGPTRLLAASSLDGVAGIRLPERVGVPASAGLVDWLATQEEEHRFVLYLADPGATPWSDVALRHADLVLLVGDAQSPAARRGWEAPLLDPPHGPVARQALLLLHRGQPATLSGTAAWLQHRHTDFHLHLRDGVPADFDRLARILDGSALGFVLGGGAARGFAHLGVYKALTEAGHPIDWVGGSSIGSVMGAAIALNLPPDDAIARARAAFVGGKPFGDLTLPVVSLLRGRRMERLIGEYLAGEIEDLPLPYFCLSSGLGSGQTRVHDRGSLPQALRASVSLPGVFPPAVIDGQLSIDGGILDNLPVDYEVDYPSVPSPWAVLAGRYLPFRRRYRVPGFLSVMLKAAEIGTMAAAREAGRRADLLIRPEVSRFSLTDVRNFGREAAATRWPD